MQRSCKTHQTIRAALRPPLPAGSPQWREAPAPSLLPCQLASPALSHPKMRHPPCHSARVVARRAGLLVLPSPHGLGAGIAAPAVCRGAATALQPHLPRPLQLTLHLQPLGVLQLHARFWWAPGLRVTATGGMHRLLQVPRKVACLSAHSAPAATITCHKMHKPAHPHALSQLTGACCTCWAPPPLPASAALRPMLTRGGTSRKAAVGRSSRVTLAGAVGGRE